MCSVGGANVFSSLPNVFSFEGNVFSFRPNVFTLAGQVFSFRRQTFSRGFVPQGADTASARAPWRFEPVIAKH